MGWDWNLIDYVDCYLCNATHRWELSMKLKELSQLFLKLYAQAKDLDVFVWVDGKEYPITAALLSTDFYHWVERDRDAPLRVIFYEEKKEELEIERRILAALAARPMRNGELLAVAKVNSYRDGEDEIYRLIREGKIIMRPDSYMELAKVKDR